MSGFAELLLRYRSLTGTEDIKLVSNLATRACGGTAVFLGSYQEVLGGTLGGRGCPLSQVFTGYCSKDMELVANLATRACDGTVVYPSIDQGVLGGILGDFVFYPVSLKCIVQKI